MVIFGSSSGFTIRLSLCYNSVHRCTLDLTGWQKSKLRTQNTPVPVMMISEPSYRSQAPVLSADPESNAITTLGVDLTSPPKVLKNTPCTLDTPRLLVAQSSSSGDICISCFEWRPAETVSWPPSKGHLLIPTPASANGRPRPVPDICRLPRYLAVISGTGRGMPFKNASELRGALWNAASSRFRLAVIRSTRYRCHQDQNSESPKLQYTPVYTKPDITKR